MNDTKIQSTETADDLLTTEIPDESPICNTWEETENSSENNGKFGKKLRPCNKKINKAKESPAESQELKALNRCMNVISNARIIDEYSIFGDFVANEMRNLKGAPDLQSQLKRNIQRTILHTADEYSRRFEFDYSTSNNEIANTFQTIYSIDSIDILIQKFA